MCKEFHIHSFKLQPHFCKINLDFSRKWKEISLFRYLETTQVVSYSETVRVIYPGTHSGGKFHPLDRVLIPRAADLINPHSPNSTCLVSVDPIKKS